MNAILLKAFSFKFLFCLVSIVNCSLFAQQPAKTQQKSILLLNGTAHLATGEVIPNAAIGFSKGKIDLVLSAIDVRLDTLVYDTIIHCKGKHIYPGFIAPNSRLGLVEIGAVRATRDYADVGDFKPHVRSLIAYNAESNIIPTIRTNGVLLAEVAPVGGRITGTSSIFELDGWNWEDAVLKEDIGIHVNWPSKRTSLGVDKENDKKNNEQYLNEIHALKNFIIEAKAYTKLIYQPESNLRFEAMRGVFDKKKKVFVHADRVQEITDAIYFFSDFNVDLVLVGGYDAWMVTDLLKDKKIPVILRRVHELPMNEDDPIDLPYKLPYLLASQGILVALENAGDMEAMGTRNLPFYAGTAVAYGVGKEEALAMITINTARILGIENKVGSIEVNKDATLIISNGDALDMRSNQIVMAFIGGKKLDLTNHQIKLWKKYSNKYD